MNMSPFHNQTIPTFNTPDLLELKILHRNTNLRLFCVSIEKTKAFAIYSYVRQWLSDLLFLVQTQAGFLYVPSHRSTMPQISMIPHPVTLNWHWDNQPCSMP